MNGASFAHLGGAVVCDHGPLSLRDARSLAVFYADEADHCRAAGAIKAGLVCTARAAALSVAAVAAARWRRAAGWRNPEAADGC